MATDPIAPDGLNLREQIARIDQLQADAARRSLVVATSPLRIAITVGAAGVATFATGAAFTKIIGG